MLLQVLGAMMLLLLLMLLLLVLGRKVVRLLRGGLWWRIRRLVVVFTLDGDRPVVGLLLDRSQADVWSLCRSRNCRSRS